MARAIVGMWLAVELAGGSYNHMDSEIKAARTYLANALSGLAPMRARVHEAYSHARECERRLASHQRYTGHLVDPSGRDRYGARISEAYADAMDAWAEYHAIESAYREARAVAVGDSERLASQQTQAESDSAAQIRDERLALPPVGWGAASASVGDRIARWRARPEADRLSDPRPRITCDRGDTGGATCDQ